MKTIKKMYSFGILSLILGACQVEPRLEKQDTPQAESPQISQRAESNALYEPAHGKVILFVGQELNAIGGLDDYSNGYMDHFQTPAGWTAYTNLTPGDTSFGFVSEGLDGVWSTRDWGDSVSNMSLQIADEDFQHMALAIGLSLVGHEEIIAEGERDNLIDTLGNYLKSLAPRPVFLRIGYEFDGHDWNHYDRESYIKAYRRIKDRLDDLGAQNVAYVWQSTGWVSDQPMLEQWYPGDAYVDWCGFSFFSRWKEQEMIDFARKKDKPVFIAEASPTISDFTVKFDGQTKETILSKPEEAQEAWDRWFVPLFKTIEDNPDVVKAVSYINCNWLSHEMWKENPTFQKVDARLQTGEWISQQWKDKIADPRYLHASPDLFELLKSHK